MSQTSDQFQVATGQRPMRKDEVPNESRVISLGVPLKVLDFPVWHRTRYLSPDLHPIPHGSDGQSIDDQFRQAVLCHVASQGRTVNFIDLGSCEKGVNAAGETLMQLSLLVDYK